MDGIVRGSARDHLEAGITAEKFLVVLIFIIRGDVVETLSNHGDEAMSGEFGVALILHGIDDLVVAYVFSLEPLGNIFKISRAHSISQAL